MSATVLSLLCLSLLSTVRGKFDQITSDIPSIDGNITKDDVTETQHATCKIITEELVASAHATATRVLSGACNAKVIDEKLENLETNLTKRLEDIEGLLRTILENDRISSKVPEVRRHEEKSRNANYNLEDTKEDVSPRQEEIDRLNGTVQDVSISNGTARAFVYFWQIWNFDEMLASWKTARFQRSSTFYVGQTGYAMYMKVTPKYFPDGTVFVGVGLTRGRHDSLLEWPFSLKIRLEILDQSSTGTKQDRRSRIWDPSTLCLDYFWCRPSLTGKPDNPECVGLSISRDVLFSTVPSSIDRRSRSTRYLWNGSITVRLTVYL